jgi:hypothetical protein
MLMELQKLRQAWAPPHMDSGDADLAGSLQGQADIWLAPPDVAGALPDAGSAWDGSFEVRRVIPGPEGDPLPDLTENAAPETAEPARTAPRAAPSMATQPPGVPDESAIFPNEPPDARSKERRKPKAERGRARRDGRAA